MRSLKERKKRGEETSKKYRALTRNDVYACAVDAITDVLLAVAQSEREAQQILQAAEIEFRNAAEAESFLAEG